MYTYKYILQRIKVKWMCKKIRKNYTKTEKVI